MSTVSVPQAALFLADHRALDFLNTVAQVDGQASDFWHSDDDVRAWLVEAGLSSGEEITDLLPGELLKEARTLRETIRTLVAQKKAGKAVDARPLNQFLASVNSIKQLVADEQGELQVETCYTGQTAARLLGPVAELAAGLIARAPFELVRQCEHPECTLWFYDRTKSHRRRWCSMALCGNRAKVARFRQQQK